MARGIIKNLVTDRGYGFISPEEQEAGARDLFFHRSDVQGVRYESLQRGQLVEYELGRDERRGTPKAVNVRPVAEG